MSYFLIAAALKPATIVLIVLCVLMIAAIIAVYFWGRKLEKQQNEVQAQMNAMAQTVSALIIDKKLLKPSESGLPAAAVEQIPWYMKRKKLPIVKAKIGPRIFTLIADGGVFDVLPTKSECKIVISGLYITEIKSVRGGAIPKSTKKKTWIQKVADKLNLSRKQLESDLESEKKSSGKSDKKNSSKKKTGTSSGSIAEKAGAKKK